MTDGARPDLDLRPWDAPGERMPRSGNRVTRSLCRSLMRLIGWRVTGHFPNHSKFVIIAAPHTSNWDFLFGVLAKGSIGLRVSFFGKASLFTPPVGWFMRWLGGQPIDRSAPKGTVAETIRLIGEAPSFVLALAPEGTRKRVPNWRTGFYQIALGAQLPIVLAYFDYAKRVVGFEQAFWPSGDLAKDLADIQSFYRSVTGKRPELFATAPIE